MENKIFILRRMNINQIIQKRIFSFDIETYATTLSLITADVTGTILQSAMNCDINTCYFYPQYLSHPLLVLMS